MISVIIPSLPDFDVLNAGTIDQWHSTCCGAELEILLEVSEGSFAVNANNGLRKATGGCIIVANNDAFPITGWTHWLDYIIRSEGNKIGIISFTPRWDCGWLFAMTRECFDTIGLFDERFVNSFDDYDLFCRSAYLGFKPIMPDKEYARHLGSKSISATYGRRKPEYFQEICANNKKLFDSRWGDLHGKVAKGPYWSNALQIMKEWKENNDPVQI